MKHLGRLLLQLFLLQHLSTAMSFYRRIIRNPFNDPHTFSDPRYTRNETDILDPQCILQVSKKTRGHFKHIVYYGQLNYVYLHLKSSNDVDIHGLKYVINERIWTWTFSGDEGALEFLSWPVEFGIWSMGLLNSYVFSMPIHIERVSGNCMNLTVGNIEDNQAISLALVQLLPGLMNVSEVTSEKYGPSEFCYKERIYITPDALYVLCKHIVCPFKAMQYNCCPYFYNQTLGRRNIDCKHPYYFQYGNLWWVGPIIVSLLLFAYLPLPLMHLSQYFSTMTSTSYVNKNKFEYFDVERETEFVFYDGQSHITLFNTLFAPLMNLLSSFQAKFSRIIRFVLPFLSLSVIGLQILIDSRYLKGYVLGSIAKGTPMGFRSMLAGYRASVTNFLPYLGGPFVALALYLGISCILILLPRSLSHHLVSGIPDVRNTQTRSPLFISLKYKELFGSITIKEESGYKKIYNMCLAQIYILLNKKYWMYAIDIQVQRWKTLKIHRRCIVIFPFYLLCCIIEHVLCLLFYGMPIVLFGFIIFKSYYKCIIRIKHEKLFGGLSFICMSILMVILIVCVTMFLFMVCTIFLDACLLLTRLFIFTYTGIVVFPRSSYGYLIFVLTTVYYLWDCVTDFSLTYRKILKCTIRVCKRLQRANDIHPLVIKAGIFMGVRKVILEHVIERNRPRRKQAFLSLLKLCIVLGAIYVSIELLTKTDQFRELHILVHVSTGLFTCAIPKIARSMFGTVEDRLARMMFEAEIKTIVCEKLNQPQDNCEISDISTWDE